ncbi:MAG: hypothetical protein SO009_05545 [Bacilli bacterium]|nr:hypothetical protein [Bacilli bacterium]
MNKKSKIIISVLVIIIFGLLAVGVMYYAKNNISSNDNQMGNVLEKPGNEDANTPPDKPEGDIMDSNDSTSDNKLNMEPGNAPMEMPNEQTCQITWEFYLVFGVISLGISLIICLMVMTGCYRISLKELFTNIDKVIILVLTLIILTTIFTYSLGLITNKFFLSSNDNKITMNDNNVSYSAKYETLKDDDLSDETYESNTKDENTILVNGDVDVNMNNITVNKSGDSDGGDNTSFYGINSAILAKSGAIVIIKNSTINTNATGANGVFSYGGSSTTNNSSNDGTTVTISDSTITTTKDNSGGIMTTGGGIMNAYNLIINTSGISSAAIRTDRGGGKVNVDGGTYTTTGQGSPIIYSTADIIVSNAKLIAKASEGVVIEGKNSVTLNNVTLTDTNNKLNGKSTTYKNIFLYQSMSGDASNGTSSFTSKNSKITTNKGDTFYVTNTTAVINLENNTITNNDKSGAFLRIKKDSWGNSGSNGGNVTLKATNQLINGDIVIDSISTLTMNLKNSNFTGKINKSNSAKSIDLNIDKDTKIKLTGNSYVTSFTNEDASNSNIDFNGYKLYVKGKAIN